MIAEELLDKAVIDGVLGPIYPWLQVVVEIKERGVERLIQALEYGLAPIHLYQYLGFGGVHDAINNEKFCKLLRVIKSKPAGLNVAIEIFSMRLYKDSERKSSPDELILTLGRELLAQIQFLRSGQKSDSMNYKLGLIADACLEGELASEATRTFCDKLAKALAEGNLYSMDYTGMLCLLAQKQPLIFLNCFLGDSSPDGHQVGAGFSFDMDEEPNPLSKIEDNIILDWCKDNPTLRYPKVASVMQTFTTDVLQSQLEWTPLALALIENASDPIPVLNELKNSLRPMSWSGSRAKIMEKRLSLLTSLKSHPTALVREWANTEEPGFQEEIAREYQSENVENRVLDERFE